MPETLFRVCWPDESHDTCYSPSTIISAYLEIQRAYSVQAFVAACREGLGAASERVQQVYHGPGCLRAKKQLTAIETKAEAFGDTEIVRVETIEVTTKEERAYHE